MTETTCINQRVNNKLEFGNNTNFTAAYGKFKESLELLNAPRKTKIDIPSEYFVINQLKGVIRDYIRQSTPISENGLYNDRIYDNWVSIIMDQLRKKCSFIDKLCPNKNNLTTLLKALYDAILSASSNIVKFGDSSNPLYVFSIATLDESLVLTDYMCENKGGKRKNAKSRNSRKTRKTRRTRRTRKAKKTRKTSRSRSSRSRRTRRFRKTLRRTKRTRRSRR